MPRAKPFFHGYRLLDSAKFSEVSFRVGASLAPIMRSKPMFLRPDIITLACRRICVCSSRAPLAPVRHLPQLPDGPAQTLLHENPSWRIEIQQRSAPDSVRSCPIRASPLPATTRRPLRGPRAAHPGFRGRRDPHSEPSSAVCSFIGCQGMSANRSQQDATA